MLNRTMFLKTPNPGGNRLSNPPKHPHCGTSRMLLTTRKRVKHESNKIVNGKTIVMSLLATSKAPTSISMGGIMYAIGDMKLINSEGCVDKMR